MCAMIWEVVASIGLTDRVVGPGEAAASQGSRSKLRQAAMAAMDDGTVTGKRFMVRPRLSRKTTGAALSARLPL